jgi:large subunit ribosomal protein L16
MLLPKRSKYRKQQKGHLAGYETRGVFHEHADFALQVVDPGWITSRQIESGRRTIARSVKRGGKIFIRIFPFKVITKKPAEVRMGSGKGSPEYWVATVRPGRIIYELHGVSAAVAEEALRLAAQKFPMKTRVIRRHALSEKVVY